MSTDECCLGLWLIKTAQVEVDREEAGDEEDDSDERDETDDEDRDDDRDDEDYDNYPEVIYQSSAHVLPSSSPV